MFANAGGELGRLFGKAKTPQSSTGQAPIPTPSQEPVPAGKTVRPQSNVSLSYKESVPQKQVKVNHQATGGVPTNPLLQEAGNGDVSAFYNINRLKVSNSAKDAIQSEISNAGKKLEGVVGKTLTNKEVLDTAGLSHV